MSNENSIFEEHDLSEYIDQKKRSSLPPHSSEINETKCMETSFTEELKTDSANNSCLDLKKENIIEKKILFPEESAYILPSLFNNNLSKTFENESLDKTENIDDLSLDEIFLSENINLSPFNSDVSLSSIEYDQNRSISEVSYSVTQAKPTYAYSNKNVKQLINQFSIEKEDSISQTSGEDLNSHQVLSPKKKKISPRIKDAVSTIDPIFINKSEIIKTGNRKPTTPRCLNDNEKYNEYICKDISIEDFNVVDYENFHLNCDSINNKSLINELTLTIVDNCLDEIYKEIEPRFQNDESKEHNIQLHNNNQLSNINTLQESERRFENCPTMSDCWATSDKSVSKNEHDFSYSLPDYCVNEGLADNYDAFSKSGISAITEESTQESDGIESPSICLPTLSNEEQYFHSPRTKSPLTELSNREQFSGVNYLPSLTTSLPVNIENCNDSDNGYDSQSKNAKYSLSYSESGRKSPYSSKNVCTKNKSTLPILKKNNQVNIKKTAHSLRPITPPSDQKTMPLSVHSSIKKYNSKSMHDLSRQCKSQESVYDPLCVSTENVRPQSPMFSRGEHKNCKYGSTLLRNCVSTMDLDKAGQKHHQSQTLNKLNKKRSASMHSIPSYRKSNFNHVHSKVKQYINDMKRKDAINKYQSSSMPTSPNKRLKSKSLGSSFIIDENLVTDLFSMNVGNENEDELPKELKELNKKLLEASNDPALLQQLLTTLMSERKSRYESDQNLAALQLNYDNLLTRYSAAENVIDDLRFDNDLRKRQENTNSANQPDMHAFSRSNTVGLNRKKSQSSDGINSFSLSKPSLNTFDDYSFNMVRATSTPIVDPYMSIGLDVDGSLKITESLPHDPSGLSLPKCVPPIQKSQIESNNSVESILSWDQELENLTKKLKEFILLEGNSKLQKEDMNQIWSFILKKYVALSSMFPSVALISTSNHCAKQLQDISQALHQIAVKYDLPLANKFMESTLKSDCFPDFSLNTSNDITKESIDASFDKSVEAVLSLDADEKNTPPPNNEGYESKPTELKSKINSAVSAQVAKPIKSTRPKLVLKTNPKPVQPRVKSHSCLDSNQKKLLQKDHDNVLKKQKEHRESLLSKQRKALHSSSLQVSLPHDKSANVSLPSPPLSSHSTNTVGPIEKVRRWQDGLDGSSSADYSSPVKPHTPPNSNVSNLKISEDPEILRKASMSLSKIKSTEDSSLNQSNNIDLYNDSNYSLRRISSAKLKDVDSGCPASDRSTGISRLPSLDPILMSTFDKGDVDQSINDEEESWNKQNDSSKALPEDDIDLELVKTAFKSIENTDASHPSANDGKNMLKASEKQTKFLKYKKSSRNARNLYDEKYVSGSELSDVSGSSASTNQINSYMLKLKRDIDLLKSQMTDLQSSAFRRKQKSNHRKNLLGKSGRPLKALGDTETTCSEDNSFGTGKYSRKMLKPNNSPTNSKQDYKLKFKINDKLEDSKLMDFLDMIENVPQSTPKGKRHKIPEANIENILDFSCTSSNAENKKSNSSHIRDDIIVPNVEATSSSQLPICSNNTIKCNQSSQSSCYKCKLTQSQPILNDLQQNLLHDSSQPVVYIQHYNCGHEKLDGIINLKADAAPRSRSRNKSYKSLMASLDETTLLAKKLRQRSRTVLGVLKYDSCSSRND